MSSPCLRVLLLSLQPSRPSTGQLMRSLLLAALLAGLCLAGVHAGSGQDVWGIDTLVNYPPGQGRKTVPNQANDDTAPMPISLKCACSDADPRDEGTQRITYTCFYQRYFNNCQQTYMFDANAELAPEGFCQMSCSRCNCCQSPYDVLTQLGATRFLQAANASSPSLTELLMHPGWTGTLLVPTDAAFDAALAQHRDVLQNPAALQEVLKFHVLPPEPVRKGLWTTPFMSLGPELYTLYDGPSALSAPRFPLPGNVTWEGGITGFQIKGPYNAATVLQSDIPACKAVITLIDAVLLPFDPAARLPADYTTAAAMMGATGCAVQPNSLIAGEEVKAGDANRQATIGACCASCSATPGCNAWRYCSQKGGCRMPDYSLFKYGYCQLLRSAELAAGQAPAYQDFNAVTMPLVSGYVVASAGPAAAAAVAPTPAQPQIPAVQAASGGAGTAGRRLFRA